jgi:hypothetical protein
LRAYAAYQHWDTATYELVLQKVKDVVLGPAPGERDDADALAVAYFRKHADGKVHLLVYNGELHDVTLDSARDAVRHDQKKLKALIAAGKPMIFFHTIRRKTAEPPCFRVTPTSERPRSFIPSGLSARRLYHDLILRVRSEYFQRNGFAAFS